MWLCEIVKDSIFSSHLVNIFMLCNFIISKSKGGSLRNYPDSANRLFHQKSVPLHVINRHKFMIFDSPSGFTAAVKSLTFSDQISSNFARIPPPLDGPIYGRLQNSARIIPRLRVNTCVAPATRDLIKMKMYHNYHSIIFLYDARKKGELIFVPKKNPVLVV